MGETEKLSALKESLEPRICWDANKLSYLSYMIIGMLLDGFQILKNKNVHRPFPYKSC